MGLDSSIAMGVRPMADPMEQAGRAMQLRQLLGQQRLQDLQFQQAQQDQQQQQQLSDALRSGVGADGKVDYGSTLAALARSGNAKGYQALLKQQQDATKADVDLGHVRAQTGELDAKTEAHKATYVRDLVSSLASNPNLTHADVINELSNVPPQYRENAARLVRSLPGDEAQIRPYLLTIGLQAQERLKALTPALQEVSDGKTKRYVDTNTLTNPGGPAPITMQTTPDADANRAQADRHFNTTRADGLAQPTYMQTDAGVVALPKRLLAGAAPTGALVAGPDGQPLQKPLQPIPAGVNTAIIGNAQNLQKAQQALALLEGGNVGAAQGDKAATGWKGMLPGPVLNRVDPAGVDTRAAIADLGSMVLHDRSGAAVTASEYPRLQPFIPTATDDASTAAKKLRRFIQVYQSEAGMLGDTYSKAQGYKPSPVTPGAPQVPAAPQATSVPQAPAAPRPGTVDSGWLFMGGDPANPASWKKAGGAR